MYVHKLEGIGTLAVTHTGRDSEGRSVYTWSVRDSFGYLLGQGNDLRSGAWLEPSEAEMVVSLVSFLGAAAESYSHAMRHGVPLADTENGTLFPPALTEWSYLNSDELALIQLEREEVDN